MKDNNMKMSLETDVGEWGLDVYFNKKEIARLASGLSIKRTFVNDLGTRITILVSNEEQ